MITKYIAALSFCSLLISCGNSQQEIDEHHAEWARNEISSYEIEYIVRCYCNEDNELQKSVIRHGAALEPGKLDIETIFDKINMSHKLGAKVSVNFDKTLSYPYEVEIEVPNKIDSNWSLKIVSFKRM